MEIREGSARELSTSQKKKRVRGEIGPSWRDNSTHELFASKKEKQALHSGMKIALEGEEGSATSVTGARDSFRTGEKISLRLKGGGPGPKGGKKKSERGILGGGGQMNELRLSG